MSWTLTTSGAAESKAGLNSNTGAASGSYTVWSDESEGRIEEDTRRTWVSSFSTLSTPIKNALSDVCSSMIAMKIIAFDSTGYLSREADMLMNMNDDIITKGLKSLRDFKSNTLKAP